MTALADESVDLVVTDPPFNVGFNYGEETDDRRPEDVYREFTRAWLEESLRVLKPGGQLYAVMPLKWMPSWIPLLEGKKWHILSWCKTMCMLHREATYLRAWEPILWIIKGKTPNVFHRSYRFAHDKDWIIGSSAIGESGKVRLKKRHPTPRPDWLYAYFIIRASEPGMVVLDPMVGSGTAAYVSMSLGRRFVGYDIREDYVRLTRERASQLSLGLQPDEGLSDFRQAALAEPYDQELVGLPSFRPRWSEMAMELAGLSPLALSAMGNLVFNLAPAPPLGSHWAEVAIGLSALPKSVQDDLMGMVKGLQLMYPNEEVSSNGRVRHPLGAEVVEAL